MDEAKTMSGDEVKTYNNDILPFGSTTYSMLVEVG